MIEKRNDDFKLQKTNHGGNRKGNKRSKPPNKARRVMQREKYISGREEKKIIIENSSPLW